MCPGSKNSQSIKKYNYLKELNYVYLPSQVKVLEERWTKILEDFRR